MKTESFVLQSPKKYHRDGLISVIAYVDKAKNEIHVQYCDESYNIVDQMTYDYNEYMDEIYKSNNLKRKNDAV